jgi:beta-glucosidase
VVQIYARALKPLITRPQKELRGFARVTLQAGAFCELNFTVPAAKLARYDELAHSFVVDPGAYEILVGASSDDIRLRARVEVAE